MAAMTDKPAQGEEAPVAFETLFPGLEEALQAIGASYLTVVLTEEGVHLATSTAPEDRDEIARLLTVVVRWALDSYTSTHGAAMAEQFFAMFVSATAQQQGWARARLKRGAN